MQAHVTASSQTYRLRERLEEANVRHGQEVRADIPNVRVVAVAGGRHEVYFCDIGAIKVREVLTNGDGLPLPAEVELDRVGFPAGGQYDMINVRVSSNGNIRLAADERTAISGRSRATRHPLAGFFLGST